MASTIHRGTAMSHADPKGAPFAPNRRQTLLALAAGASAALGLGHSALARQVAAGWSSEALHGFTWSEGSRAVGSPVFGPDGALYGVHAMGGERGLGSVFRWSPYDGSFAMLHHFDYTDVGPAEPEAGLIVGSDGLLWGTSLFGGALFRGTIYTLALDGTVTVRAEFGETSTMSMPQGALVEGRPGRFYGTTGASVYRFDAARGKLKELYRFNNATDGSGSDAALVFGADGKLYGCNPNGGSQGHGTLFRINTDGTDFKVLKALDGKWEGSGLGSPLLLASDGMFYGCASGGGVFSRGVVFRLGADGLYEVLHHFAGGSNDGAYPRAALVEGPDGALYGNTVEGGDAPQSYGTVYRMTKRGKLSLLRRLKENGADGTTPVGALCFGSDGQLYGTDQSGGGGGTGVLYRLSTA